MPKASKNTIIRGNEENYLDWLKERYPESHGNSDLVAYFFRRAFDLLRQGGTLGLIATNTLAQGDTRSTGLRWICQHSGTIYNAYRWNEATQDEVLARLLDLNQKRYEQEILGGTGTQGKKTKGRAKATKSVSPTIPGLEA